MGSCVLSGNGMRVYGCVECMFVSSVGQGRVIDAHFSGKRAEINMQTQCSSFTLASEKYFSYKLITIHIHRMQIDRGAAFWLSCLILQPSHVLKRAS